MSDIEYSVIMSDVIKSLTVLPTSLRTMTKFATSCMVALAKWRSPFSVLTTSTEIILGTRKCGPCQEPVFIYFKLQEAIEAVKPFDL